MNRTELQSQTLAKAATDSAFRQQLIRDPREAIAQAFGVLLPSNLEISIIEESPTRLCLVLPPATSNELSEADLSDVSGGVWRKSPVAGPNWDDREPL
jgi:hypothetical protein